MRKVAGKSQGKDNVGGFSTQERWQHSAGATSVAGMRIEHRGAGDAVDNQNCKSRLLKLSDAASVKSRSPWFFGAGKAVDRC